MATLKAALSADIIKAFDDFKMKSQYSYIILMLSGSDVVIETLGKPGEKFENFIEHMPEKEPRYALFDLEVKFPDGHSQKKIIFFHYCPDECSIKSKMMFAASKESIKSKLEGIEKEFQITAKKDLSREKCVDAFLGGKVL